MKAGVTLFFVRHGETDWNAAGILQGWIDVPLNDAGLIQAVAVHQRPTFEAAVQFAGLEGILPAPESAHAIRTAIDEALDAKAKGEKRVILFNLSGHGNFDLTAYQAYLSGELDDIDYPIDAEEIKTHLPQVTVPA